MSPVLDYGDPTTTWIAIEWSSDEPDGTSIELSYRVDGGPWSLATNGGPIGATGQRFQVRARLLAPPEAPVGPTLNEVAVFYE